MYKLNKYFFTLLSLLVFLLTTGCEDKKKAPIAITIEETISVQNTTNVTTKINSIESNTSIKEDKNSSIIQNTIIKPTDTKDIFTLQGLENNVYTIQFNQNMIHIKESHKEIIVLSLFSTWCKPCITQISYLDDLQKRYTKNLLFASLLVNDDISKTELKSLLFQEQIYSFISYSHPHFIAQLLDRLNLPKNYTIPLTVMYVDGKYFTHYEGIVPIEMIEYDIKKATKILEQKY